LVPRFDRSESIESTALLFQNVVGGLGPGERFGIGIVAVEIVMDRALELGATLVKVPRQIRLAVISVTV